MRFFHAPLFAQTIQSFQLIQDNCEFATRSGSGSSHLPDAKVELLISTVQDARAWCERTLLHASVKKLDLSLMHFKAECASLSWTAAGVEVRNIIESIMLEAQGIWLVAIEPDRVQVLTIVQPFGADVEESFPAAATDIREASLCLAMERNTAAVFHLMRAAEYGMRALAADREITLDKDKPIELGTWEEMIRKLEAAEVAIQNYPKTLAREKQFDFYHGAMMELKRFKNKYRNSVMHTREEYDRDEAHSAFVHVQKFMQILSTKIGNGKTTPKVWA